VNALFDFFDTDGFMPHGYCLMWRPLVFWTNLVSDGIIALAYYSIPFALLYFALRRRDLMFRGVFVMFGIFILGCGSTHIMGIWTLWNPDYGVDGLIKALTAIVSITTAVVLWPLMPKMLTLPSPAQLEQANRDLNRQIAERYAADIAVRRLNDDLSVEIRTKNEALKALQMSEQKFRLLLDGVTDYAILMLDPKGNVINWNSGAQRIKGYAAEEIIGQNISVFYTPEQGDQDQLGRMLATAASAGRFETETWLARKDGRRFLANIVCEAIRDDSGQLVGFANITRDITERRAVDDQLRQAQKMEAVGHLTGGVAHDFNNLLTAVGGSLQLLKLRLPSPSEDIQSLLDMAQRGVERSATLTRRLLAFSRRQTLSPRATDLNTLVREISEILRRTLGENVELKPVLSDGVWRTYADANQIESALVNLAVNARDAMPSGGKLTIETQNIFLDAAYARTHTDVSPGQYVMMAVSDTGVGMSAEVMARAYEPFFTTKEAGKGTGLGLSQVYGFVRQSGGHIQIYSEPGMGTTVKIYLPRLMTEDEPVTAAAQQPLASEPGRECILVVEDDSDVRSYAVQALTQLGYRVLDAADAEGAIRIAKSHPEIELLFTDVGLPRVNGRQLAEHLRHLNPGLRVLYASGYARNAIVHNGILDPGVELLAKPYTIEELARKVRQMFDAELAA